MIPNAISLTEKEGQAYVQTADNLDLLMEKKRVNALLNAKEEAYTAAIQNQAEAMQNLITLEDDIATKKQELIEKEKELQDAADERQYRATDKSHVCFAAGKG